MHCAFGHMEKLPLVEFVSNFCRGFGQVVFLDNPLSGIFIIVAIVLPQLDDFLVSTIVTIVAYSTFYCLVGNAKEKGLNTGLYLYNAVLVGMAIGVFYPSSSEDHGFRYLHSMFASFESSFFLLKGKIIASQQKKSTVKRSFFLLLKRASRFAHLCEKG